MRIVTIPQVTVVVHAGLIQPLTKFSHYCILTYIINCGEKGKIFKHSQWVPCQLIFCHVDVNWVIESRAFPWARLPTWAWSALTAAGALGWAPTCGGKKEERSTMSLCTPKTNPKCRQPRLSGQQPSRHFHTQAWSTNCVRPFPRGVCAPYSSQ